MLCIYIVTLTFGEHTPPPSLVSLNQLVAQACQAQRYSDAIETEERTCIELECHRARWLGILMTKLRKRQLCQATYQSV